MKNPFKTTPATARTSQQNAAEVIEMHRQGAVNAPTDRQRAEHAESLRISLLGEGEYDGR